MGIATDGMFKMPFDVTTSIVRNEPPSPCHCAPDGIVPEMVQRRDGSGQRSCHQRSRQGAVGMQAHCAEDVARRSLGVFDVGLAQFPRSFFIL